MMMSDQLPEGWVWTTLGKATQPMQRRVNPQDYPEMPYIGMENVEAHTMQLLGTVPARQMKSLADSFIAGDVLYGRLRPYLNKVLCPDFSGLCSTEFIVFRQVPHIYSKYLQYFLNSWEFVTFSNSLNAGDRPRVKFEQFADYPFPLPPLAEQERIVAKIEALFSQLDAGVAALRRIQAALKRYKASVLKAACEGRLVGQDPTDEPAEALLRRLGKAPLVDDDLPALPEGWCWVRVGEVAEINPKDALIRTLPDSLPVSFVPMAAVDAYLGIVLNPEEQPLGKVRKGYTQFSNGDVLFAKITPCMENGKAAIAYDLLNNRGFGSTEFHVLRPCKAVNAQWLFHFIRQERFRSEAKAHFTGTAGQLRVPITFLSNYQMPLPPLIEQQRIVVEIEHRLSIIVEVESIVSALLARSARLRQAILKQAFEGKLV